MPMVSPNLTGHVTLHFDCLDKNLLLPFTMPLASYVVDADANGVTWPKKSHCTSFQSSWPEEFNDVIYNAISIPCYWCWCQWCLVTQKSCCTSFQLSCPKKLNGVIYNSFGIMWHLISTILTWGIKCHHLQCQWSHVTPMKFHLASHDQKHIKSHFNHLDLMTICMSLYTQTEREREM